MRVVQVYVESGVSMASDDGTSAWVFEPDWWGCCGQGGDEDSALAALRDELQAGDPASAQQLQPESIRFEVVERVAGDEQLVPSNEPGRNSRYSLPSLGLPAREADPDLDTELAASAEHVRQPVETMPADLVRKAEGEIWTSTKVLRRLAWHGRSELRTLHRLARIAGRPPLTKPDRLA